ncbi:MAG: hypothetical protein JWO56_2182 [Acidobacteria bacterium]|nr:hypothetical protein [Acidobacteriota bacterium]
MTREMLATLFELETSLAAHGIQDVEQVHENATRLVYNLAWKKYGLPPADAVELAKQTWQQYVRQRD